MRGMMVAGLMCGASVVAWPCSASAQAAQGKQDDPAALQAQLDAANARVEALERRLEALESQAGLGQAPLVSDADKAGMRGRGYAIQQTPPAEAPSVAQGLEPDRKAPAPTDAVETVTRAQQGTYGARLTLEPGLTYSHFTNAQLNLSGFLALDAIFLGLISIDEVEADVVTADLTARYGLTDRLQLDVNVPYLVRRSTFRSGGAGGNASGLAEKTVKSSGLGDISFGASYRLFRETARRPDVVINARLKSPTGRHPFGVELEEVDDTEGNLSVPGRLSTGTGVWSAAAGVSALKTIDPMVVFGSLTYFHNFQRKFKDLDEIQGDQPGRARLGSAIQYGLGVAYALNEVSSLSMSFTQRFVRSTRIRRDVDDEWQRVIGSTANVGTLNLGATFSLSRDIALLANLATGVTDDAPDMVLSFRIPYRF